MKGHAFCSWPPLFTPVSWWAELCQENGFVMLSPIGAPGSKTSKTTSKTYLDLKPQPTPLWDCLLQMYNCVWLCISFEINPLEMNKVPVFWQDTLVFQYTLKCDWLCNGFLLEFRWKENVWQQTPLSLNHIFYPIILVQVECPWTYLIFVVLETLVYLLRLTVMITV